MASAPVSHAEDVQTPARRRFDELDWPTPQEEEWRRTDVTAFPFEEFTQHHDRTAPYLDGPRPLTGIERTATFRFAGNRVVSSSESVDLAGLGVEFAVIAPDGGAPQSVVHMLAAEPLTNRIEAWHYALPMHGAYLKVPRGVKLSLPLLVEHAESGSSHLANPHLSILVEDGASVEVIHYVRSNEDRLLCNLGLDASIGDGASLSLVSVLDLGSQTTGFAHRNTTLGRDARFNHFEMVLGGKLTKTRNLVSLRGQGAEADLHGAYFGVEESHHDLRTVQYHQAPHTRSRAFYKGAVRDSARTVYQGLIEVDHEARQTDAYLSNRNLVLNDGARADSIPSLKIRTNEVKCSHGSTTGRVDEEQLFYLMSRGFPETEARRAIIEGYFEDVTRHAPEASREELMDRIAGRLRNAGTEPEAS